MFKAMHNISEFIGCKVIINVRVATLHYVDSSCSLKQTTPEDSTGTLADSAKIAVESNFVM